MHIRRQPRQLSHSVESVLGEKEKEELNEMNDLCSGYCSVHFENPYGGFCAPAEAEKVLVSLNNIS